ncbi:hypothetical protein OUY22_14135 [Nonomuraea sp. MCN248]|uniref:Uncharacterized protein n=1 Tax=Nonomuraea corallina TaxID=2989783 RepID=A0ABT4SC48_9ACTN|nr:hypothetical protein [Nonomuraea corallina]MDA0634560.1 hypothetical protein [Nonomuraea corallina]
MLEDARQRLAAGTLGVLATAAFGTIVATPAQAATTQEVSTADSAQSDIRASLALATVSSIDTAPAASVACIVAG